MKFDMLKWVETLLSSSEKIAFPIITYPGLELTGKQVNEMATSGLVQFQCVKALAQRYPQMPAIPMSMDLSLEAEAFGSKVRFSADEIPTVSERLIVYSSDIKNLIIPEVNTPRICEYIKATELVVAENMGKPVFGGVIGPFSLAGRLLDMTEIMTGILMEPDEMHLLLEKCTSFINKYLAKQISAGANGVIMAEPAAGLLAPEQCEEFSSAYIRQIVEKTQNQNFLFVLHNCGHTETLMESMVGTGARAFHIGNAVDIMDILPQVPCDRLVFGNLDPVNLVKTGTPELISTRIKELRERTHAYKNFVISTGCDVPPGTALKNVDAFFEKTN